MKKLQTSSLEKLKYLTKMQKSLKVAELTQLRLLLLRMDEEIAKLKAPVPNTNNISEIKQNASWQNWRREEILRINMKKTEIHTKYIQASIAAGQATAEDEVVTYLTKTAREAEKVSRRRKAELKMSSHFLPNNISN